MAKLTFVRATESGKSAVCMLKQSEFEFGGTPVYTPLAPWGESPSKGDSVEIPNSFKLVTMVDTETGEELTTKDGEPRRVLQFH